MLKNLKNTKAQAVGSEYVLVFFLVLGMLTAMTIYFKRGLQATIRDAGYSMVDIVQDRAGAAVNGVVFRQYEPYYLNSIGTTDRVEISDTRVEAIPGLSSGIYRKTIDEFTATHQESTTAPPKEAQ